MKRILWAGLLIFSLNSFAFLEDEEAREKINDLQNQLNSLKTEKLVDLEGKITDLQQVLQGGSLQQFNNKINEIFDDLAKLRGDVEVLQFGLQSFEDRQKLNYQDIESRFEKLEQQLELLQEQPKKQLDVVQDQSNQLNQDPINNINQNAVESVQNAINQELLNEEQVSPADQNKENVVENKLPPLIDEEQAMNMFNDAEGLMRSTKYKEAFELFDRFVTTYPKSQRLVEAKKNIGFIQFALKNYNASLKTYEKLIQNHPDHELMPEILYGKANTEIQLTRITKAKQTLRKIIKDYPNASNIESAKKRLKALESIKL
ncbi:tetratricopeptide repeat protein [Methylophilaceae bacterium]|jgi:tol-pal system protein YbgF|nr:tetratricopeptide repeat protein [Methylophilaceae bacterium]